MPRGGAHFSSKELVKVLSYYDIGVIEQVASLSSGSKRAPKMVITSERGKFLLKRRPKGKDDLYRAAFSHAVQTHLAKKGFSVASLITTRDENNTVLQLNNHIYELFEFVEGSRYDGSAEATIDAGRQLAKFHKALADFAGRKELTLGLRRSFHDASNVRRRLRTVGSEKTSRPNRKLQKIGETLMALYNDSSVCVSGLGFDSWDEQIVHGDWHPGNMLFAGRKFIAVLDFGSVKIAPPVTDLANGMLQFSIVGSRPNPADWPAYLDQAKLVQFLDGYRKVIKLDEYRLRVLPCLMIETMIAEAVLPIAATGFFAHLSGYDFLKMIRRKTEWLKKNQKKLTEAISS